jgi:hypothetical protein
MIKLLGANHSTSLSNRCAMLKTLILKAFCKVLGRKEEKPANLTG